MITIPEELSPPDKLQDIQYFPSPKIIKIPEIPRLSESGSKATMLPDNQGNETHSEDQI